MTSAEQDFDSMSLSDNIELTHEEENTLLGGNGEEMAVDSELNSTQEETKNKRKSIVYDLKDTEEDDDDKEDSGRYKFKSERTMEMERTNIFSLKGQETRRNIPDTLGVERTRREFGIRATNKNNFISRRRKKNRGFSRFGESYGRSGPTSDLRSFINQTRNTGHSRIPHNILSGLGLNSSVHNYQMRLGILNPIIAQNQLLINALMAQNPNNPLVNRLQVSGKSLLNEQNNYRKPDDIQITIRNTEVKPKNITTMQTKSRIRCFVSQDDSMADTSDCEVIENTASTPQTSEIRQPRDKTPFKTLFAKHLETKANQSKAEKQENSGLFGDAFAEVEVGVDNDYLRKMEEMKKKREEILRKKEEARLAMADQRMEAAMKLKEKIDMF